MGSRLEEDALLLCRLASTKSGLGQRAAVALHEYLAHYASSSCEESEPDALGLRRRRPRKAAAAEAVRARARGLMLAKQLLQASGSNPDAHGAAGGSTARPAASAAASSRAVLTRTAANVSKTL